MKLLKLGLLGMVAFWGSLVGVVLLVAGGGGTIEAGTQESRAADLPPGALMWPVVGPITDGFGMREDPFPPHNMEMHTGIDIAAPEGTPVQAAISGTVEFAGWSGNYGNLVIVAGAGGLETYYGHLSAMYVSQGERVERGETLGAVGSTGRSTGPHLHFEVRVRGQPVDPINL